MTATTYPGSFAPPVRAGRGGTRLAKAVVALAALIVVGLATALALSLTNSPAQSTPRPPAVHLAPTNPAQWTVTLCYSTGCTRINPQGLPIAPVAH